MKLTLLDECLASIIGNCLVSGVLQREADTDLAKEKAAVGESLLFLCTKSSLNCTHNNMPLGKSYMVSETKKTTLVFHMTGYVTIRGCISKYM